MTFKPAAFSPRDSEFIQGSKLRREVSASMAQIPLPLVGILDHATFSNIKEQHKHLYQDTLGPIFEMIQQEVERQILPECQDTENVYCEFNIAAKLAGSFEEQANALRVLIGRPLMTANEGRARLNLPAIQDDPTADQLAAQQGGPSSTTDPAAVSGLNTDVTAEVVPIIVRAHWARQAMRLAKVPVSQRAGKLDPSRCATELATDLRVILTGEAATAYASTVTDDTYTLLLEGREAFDVKREVPLCPA